MAQIELKIEFPTEGEFARLFPTVPVLDRFSVLDRAARAAAKVIHARAKELAPRSAKTGSKKKWSKAMTTTGTPKNKTPRRLDERPLWRTVGVTLKKYDGTVWVGVGPTWPDGNKAHFNSAHVKGSRTVVFWGKRTGKQAIQEVNWMQKAGDETQHEQNAAMVASLKKSIDEMMPR